MDGKKKIEIVPGDGNIVISPAEDISYSIQYGRTRAKRNLSTPMPLSVSAASPTSVIRSLKPAR